MAARSIVNADDLGYSQGRNDGIIRCIKSGVVLSCSLLVNSYFAHQAAEAVKDLPVSLGLHINLTEGKPILTHHKSLCNASGFLFEKTEIESLVHSRSIDLKEIRQEITAQVDKFIKLCGKLPSHVDGHQHVHVIQGIREVIVDIARSYGIKRIRIPYDVSVDETEYLEPHQKSFFTTVTKNSALFLNELKDSDIRSTKHFIGLSLMGDNLNEENLQRCLKNLNTGKSSYRSAGSKEKVNGDVIVRSDDSFSAEMCHETVNDNLLPTTELMCHPGVSDTSDVGGCGSGVDTFSKSVQRQHELDFLTGHKFQRLLRDNNLIISSYYDV